MDDFSENQKNSLKSQYKHFQKKLKFSRKFRLFLKNFILTFQLKFLISPKKSPIFFFNADESKRVVREDELIFLLRVFNIVNPIAGTVMSAIFEAVRLRKEFLREQK